jgi:hypothetical protein
MLAHFGLFARDTLTGIEKFIGPEQQMALRQCHGHSKAGPTTEIQHSEFSNEKVEDHG